MTAATKSKPGTRTTEFYVTIAVMVAAVILAVAGRIPGADALAACTAAGGTYSISRGIAKTGS